MTKQINLPAAAADAAKPGYLGTIRLSGVSAIATSLELAARATAGRRGRLLHHLWTFAADQNETLVSQYFGGFPSRDIVNEPSNAISNARQAGVMTGIFGLRDAGRWESLK
jgi:hypothetical protein